MSSVITKEYLMHCVHYYLNGTTRRVTDGIELLVMRKFGSLRTFEQGYRDLVITTSNLLN